MSDQQITPEAQHLSDEGHAVYEAVVPLVKESKAGYKTTEFWLAVAGAVFVNVGPAVPDKWQAILTAGLAAVYALSRGVAKAGIPDVVEPAKD